MPFDGFQGFTTWDSKEDDLSDPCNGNNLIMEFRRDDDVVLIFDSPDHGVYAVYHDLHYLHNVYYMDSLQILLPLVPSLLNTDWEVAEYNAELVTEQFDTQLPSAVTALGE
uniref:Uncharacterized protein n=1 Tax=Natronorubrum tibetense GA33 TaxID=1114856 RepID=L9VRM6_9EURY|nr:hypothetical protein [Natronorubrum tibetense]ELY39819.1 hypothetical protein C496_14116 [Natronorubrum tibetense GA33]